MIPGRADPERGTALGHPDVAEHGAGQRSEMHGALVEEEPPGDFPSSLQREEPVIRHVDSHVPAAADRAGAEVDRRDVVSVSNEQRISRTPSDVVGRKKVRVRHAQARVPDHEAVRRSAASARVEERQTVVAALARADGNIVKAAEMLGVSRPTLYDLMNRLQIK